MYSGFGSISAEITFTVVYIYRGRVVTGKGRHFYPCLRLFINFFQSNAAELLINPLPYLGENATKNSIKY
jgi:hypothetical protein